MAAIQLSPEEATSICTAAAATWGKVSGKATTARFTWVGKPYVASRSSFRLEVHMLDGQPVASRHD